MSPACEACRADLLDFHQGALEGDARLRVTTHLSSCASCSAELSALDAGHRALADWPDRPVPPGLAARSLKALEVFGFDAHAHVPHADPDPEPRRARAPRKLFRPMLTPLAACALLACAGYYAHVAGMQVRMGAEMFGASTLAPDAMSLVRLSLFDVSDHRPLPDRAVSVSLRNAQGANIPLYRGRSDSRGQVAAKLKLPALPDGDYQLVVEALDGRDRATIQSPITVKRSYRLLLSTDKPLYQPGQVIHVRALAFDAALHQPAKGATLTFSVSDPKGSRIFKTHAPVDAYGVAHFDLPLARVLNLGQYKVVAELGDTQSEADVEIARYALPKFAVTLKPTSTWVRPGEALTGTVSARTFFGRPVRGAKISVTAGVFIDGFRALAHTDVVADDDGHAAFTLPMPAALPGNALAGGNAVLQLTAQVHDGAGEAVSKQAEVIVSPSRLMLTAVPENGSWALGVSNTLLVLVSRPDGEPEPGAQIAVDGVPTHIRTDDSGVAKVSFVPHSDREKITVDAVGADGARATHLVALTGQPRFALIRTDKSLYAAGATVDMHVLATSAMKLAYLDVVRDGQTVLTQTIDLRGGQGALQFDLPPELAGALTLEVYAQSGGQLMRTRRVIYVADARGLNVSVSVDRQTHKPGETATLRFHVTDERGHPTAAGLGLSVVDESVFALAQQQPAMLRTFLNLAKSLRTPRYHLNPTQVLAQAHAQSAADLLFSGTDTTSQVARLAHTDPQELSVRRAAMGAFKDKRTGTAYFAGLFMLGLMLEGVLRMLAEKLLLSLVKRRLGQLILGCGVLFVLVDLATDDTAGAAWLAGLVAATGALILLGLYTRFANVGWVLGALALFLMISTALFGDNIRKMFGASVDSLSGLATRDTGARRGADHRNVVDFASSATEAGRGDDEGKVDVQEAKQDDAANLAQREGMAEHAGGGLGDHINQLRHMRQSTIQVIKGTGEVGEAPTDRGGMGTDLKNAVGTLRTPKPAAPLTAKQKAQVRMRSFFPETLFWNPELITNAKGDAQVEIPLADSITTWRAAITASAADGRLGTGQASLQVTQDFFVDLDLPPVLTVGDVVQIPIAIHSTLAAPETVTVEVEPAAWFTTTAPHAQTITVQPGQVAGVTLPLTAVKFGPDQKLTVYAVGPNGKDAIAREVEVLPAGVPFDDVRNGTTQRGDTASIAVPSDAIAGASHAELRLYPSTFSAVMDGLQNVLRMPAGCFEQTSSTTYPNALVLQYLRDHKQGTPELIARAEGYLTTGYQHLLSFEVPGGGFEWFGRAPANQVLTAYGLLEFSDMAKVFPIDPAVIARTEAFLVSRQEYDGSFAPDAEALADGLYRSQFAARFTTTAYVTWAMAESGSHTDATRRAAHYLVEHLSANHDTYSLALAASALVSLDADGAQHAVALLRSRAETQDGQRFFPAQGGTVTAAHGTDADVETTALAAEALLHAGRLSEARAALKWLLTARDPHGTWHSTQATVLALRVLLEAAHDPALTTGTGTLTVTTPAGVRTVHFTPDQSDVVQRLDLTDAIDSAGGVSLRFGGDAMASYQLEVSGYRPLATKPEPALALALDYDHPSLQEGDTMQATLTARYQRESPSGMVLIEVAVPPGFDAVEDTLAQLVNGGQIARYEHTGALLRLYVDRLTRDQPLTLHYALHARYPVRVTARASSAYLYYQPSVRAASRPVVLDVAAR